MTDDAEAVVKAVMAAAKGGDMTAARLVLDRIAPPCREVPVTLELPRLEAWEGRRSASQRPLDKKEELSGCCLPQGRGSGRRTA
jgi:hypothetical protein